MILTLFTSLYQIVALLLALYTGGQCLLLLQYLRPHNHEHTHQDTRHAALPSVTIQLPIYNERHVVLRLLQAMTQLDYPPAQLHIQVLDDSDDETCPLIAAQVAILKQHGIQIQHLRRPERTGYKAGALAYGLTQTNSEFIAIFDADFVPPPDFLKRSLAVLLANDHYGFVQTRWGHLNHNENWLTRAQALSVDTHFWIEQAGRYRAGYFLPFNGTGGVWRRTCIETAGGWSSETLTEDLDLSYRAQLQGWHAAYLPQVVVPGELPAQLGAYRQQQARWATGSTQALLKLAPRIFRAQLPIMTRLMAWHHLAQYLPQPLILLLLILSPLILLNPISINLTLPGLMAFVPPLMYILTQRQLYKNPAQHLLAFPFLLLLATGMVWSNTKAILHARNGQKQEFRRTPKFATHQPDTYTLPKNRLTGEWALLLYALFSTALALHQQSGMSLYLLLYVASFALIIARQKWEYRGQSGYPDTPKKTPNPVNIAHNETTQQPSWHNVAS